jgi:hypothetical protein
MPQATLTEIFGSGATRTAGAVTIDFETLETTTGLDDATTATPSQLGGALLRYWSLQTAWGTDKDKGIAPGLAQTKQVITNRGGETVAQIARPITINCYEADNNATFDPDNIL